MHRDAVASCSAEVTTTFGGTTSVSTLIFDEYGWPAAAIGDSPDEHTWTYVREDGKVVSSTETYGPDSVTSTFDEHEHQTSFDGEPCVLVHDGDRLVSSSCTGVATTFDACEWPVTENDGGDVSTATITYSRPCVRASVTWDGPFPQELTFDEQGRVVQQTFTDADLAGSTVWTCP